MKKMKLMILIGLIAISTTACGNKTEEIKTNKVEVETEQEVHSTIDDISEYAMGVLIEEEPEIKNEEEIIIEETSSEENDKNDEIELIEVEDTKEKETITIITKEDTSIIEEQKDIKVITPTPVVITNNDTKTEETVNTNITETKKEETTNTQETTSESENKEVVTPTPTPVPTQTPEVTPTPAPVVTPVPETPEVVVTPEEPEEEEVEEEITNEVRGYEVVLNNSECRTSTINYVKEAINKMPSSLLDNFSGKFIICKNINEVYEFADFATVGLYHDGNIYLKERGEGFEYTYYHTVAHELSHVLDLKKGNEAGYNYYYSGRNEEWENLFNTYGATFVNSEGSNYGSSLITEFFAECMSEFITNPTYLQTNYSELYEACAKM